MVDTNFTLICFVAIDKHCKFCTSLQLIEIQSDVPNISRYFFKLYFNIHFIIVIIPFKKKIGLFFIIKICDHI